MPTFQRCEAEMKKLAARIIDGDEELAHLREANVRLDLVWARADVDENDASIRLNDAITHQGHRALGLASIRNLKARTLMGYDGEILLDGDWWDTANEHQQEALLAHELFHFLVKKTDGLVCTDDLGRPILKMRKHDFEFGWFAHTAARYGEFSQERIQARQIVEGAYGQLLFPELIDKIIPMEPAGGVGAGLKRAVEGLKRSARGGSVTISGGGKSVTIEGDSEARAASKGGA